jgi:cytosine/adenosine deaminase-related metal-dependent hydrolase
MLGTDGIGGDLWREARAAVFKSHDAGLALPPPRLLPLLAESARCASGCLGVRLGRLEPGAAADLLVTRYVPATELTAENLVDHLLYGMGAEFVRHVMVDGRWVLRDGHIVSCDPAQVRRRAVPVARGLHQRMAALPCD